MIMIVMIILIIFTSFKFTAHKSCTVQQYSEQSAVDRQTRTIALAAFLASVGSLPMMIISGHVMPTIKYVTFKMMIMMIFTLTMIHVKLDMLVHS